MDEPLPEFLTPEAFGHKECCNDEAPQRVVGTFQLGILGEESKHISFISEPSQMNAQTAH